MNISKKIKLICTQCHCEFEVIKSRKNAKFCSRDCYHLSTVGKPAWNSGRAYDELYTKEAIEKIKQKQRLIGELNPMYGKSHTSETLEKMKGPRPDFVPWIKGLTKESCNFLQDLSTRQHRDNTAKSIEARKRFE